MPPVCWVWIWKGFTARVISCWPTVRLLGLPMFFCFNLFPFISPPFPRPKLSTCCVYFTSLRLWCPQVWLKPVLVVGTGGRLLTDPPDTPLWHGLRNLISLECCVDGWEKSCEEDSVPEANRAPWLLNSPLWDWRGDGASHKGDNLSLGRVETERCSKSHGGFSFSADSFHLLVHSLTLTHSLTHSLACSFLQNILLQCLLPPRH